MRVHQLFMNAEGWLVAAPHRFAGGSFPLEHASAVPGDYKLIAHGKTISPEVSTSVLVRLHPSGKVSGAASGRWWLSRDGAFTVVLDGSTYRGVFTTQWDDDHGAWVYAFSALSRDGVAVWGSQTIVAKEPPRVVPLQDLFAQYDETFSFRVPEPHWSRRHVYSYSVAGGPAGLTVDRKTGVLTWRPALSDVGIPHEVTIRALKIEPGDPDQLLYTFTVTATSRTVVRRVDLDFSAAGSAGLRDATGQFTGLTTRLPGTGTALPEADPNLRLDTAAGVLALSTTRADFFGRAGLAATSSPGLALADLGFTGTEDFAVTATFRPLTGLGFIDQVGLYVGASSDAITRAGTIVFGAPERYSVHSQNGADHGGRFFGFGFNGERRDDGDDHAGGRRVALLR